MNVKSDREPFLIEFTLEELQHLEEALASARTAEYQHAQQLIATVNMEQRLKPEQFTRELDGLLAAFERLDLWNEMIHGPMDGFDDLDDDWGEWTGGPHLPCHLMPRPASGR
jgi:hypothetical protein